MCKKLLFTAIIFTPLFSSSQNNSLKSYEYSFGHESSTPGHLVSVFHQLVFMGENDCQYQRCKVAYQSGNFKKPNPIDTLTISGKYHYDPVKGLIWLDFTGLDSGLEFSLTGKYRLEERLIICLNKENRWFYNHPMFELEHFEHCTESPSYKQTREIKKVVHKRTIQLWTCEVEYWAQDIEVK